MPLHLAHQFFTDPNTSLQNHPGIVQTAMVTEDTSYCLVEMLCSDQRCGKALGHILTSYPDCRQSKKEMQCEEAVWDVCGNVGSKTQRRLAAVFL